MADEIRLEKDDVTVEPIFDECGQCTNTLGGDSFTVAIDFRAAGMTERLGRYCETCAEEIARRIRAGLPDPMMPELAQAQRARAAAVSAIQDYAEGWTDGKGGWDRVERALTAFAEAAAGADGSERRAV